MKISLITLHRVFNFGSFLQTYALQEYLMKCGHEVEVLDYEPPQNSNKSYFWDYDRRKKKNFLAALCYNAAVFPKRFWRKQIFERELNRHIHTSARRYHSLAEIEEHAPMADLYLTGSDQVWNSEYNRGVDPAFFLAYAPPGKKRLAYGASFGRERLHTFELEPLKRLLQSYEGVSVRENSALPLLRTLGRSDAVQVLDPTFLLTAAEWFFFAAPPLLTKRYLLIYQLNRNPSLVATAVKIAREKGLSVVKLSLNWTKPAGVAVAFNTITPSQFLSLVAYADFVVTDSFHGGAFSINLHKDFAVVLPDRYGTRLISLLETLGLETRLAQNENLQPLLSPLPQESLTLRLQAEREKSYAFLQRFIS